MQQPSDGKIAIYISRHIQQRINCEITLITSRQLVGVHVFLLKSSLICTEDVDTMHMQHNHIMYVTLFSSTFSDRTLSLASLPAFHCWKIDFLLHVQNFNFTSSKTVWKCHAKTCNICYVSVSILISTWCIIWFWNILDLQNVGLSWNDIPSKFGVFKFSHAVWGIR